MKLQTEIQRAQISDAARSRIALALPVLKGMLFALKRERVERLGGYNKITLTDLAREYREGDGDCGVCFEYAVHDAIRDKDPNIYPLLSDVLEQYCGIKSGAESIFSAPRKPVTFPSLRRHRSLLMTNHVYFLVRSANRRN